MASIEIPGKHQNLISPSQAIERNPNFFQLRQEQAGDHALWKTYVVIPPTSSPITLKPGETTQLPLGTDTQIKSDQYGSAMVTVVVNRDGEPGYDKITVHESPSINIVAWYKSPTDGQVYIGMLSQKRPHAEQPEENEGQAEEPVVFRQIPMGFRDKILDPHTHEERLETIEEAAQRELGEELIHGQVIKNMMIPPISMSYINPSFVQDGANMVFVEIDPLKLEEARIQTDTQEGILKAQFIRLEVALEEIQNGQTEDGAIARSATSNAALFTYLTQLPAFIHALHNRQILDRQVEQNKKMKAKNPAAYKTLKLQEFALRDPEKYHVYQENHPTRRMYQISTNPAEYSLIK